MAMSTDSTATASTTTPTATSETNAELERRWAVIQPKLEANACWLGRQGTLVAKEADGRRVWVVRFVREVQDKRVHKAIYIGTNGQTELLRRTETLLVYYRSEDFWVRNLSRQARNVKVMARMVRALG